jgi:hypothetical protein
MGENTMKTLDECLEEAENKYSRKSTDGFNIDSLYPILKQIIKEGTKTWLTQKRQAMTDKIEKENTVYVTFFISDKLDFIDELLEELEK